MNHRSTSVSTQIVWVCMALALVIQLGLSSPLLTHHVMKRKIFFHLECKGQYNKSKFARLDRICEDCYNLFREPEVHSLCRKNCFTSEYFKGCLETLQLQDQIGEFIEIIKELHGAPPYGLDPSASNLNTSEAA